MPPFKPLPLAIATLLAGHGMRKGSLSTSGAVAAFNVGYLHLAGDLKLFGVALIAFCTCWWTGLAEFEK
jgi:hypothetical protein